MCFLSCSDQTQNTFCSNFVYFFSKELMLSFYDFYILNEVLFQQQDPFFWMKSDRNLFLLKLSFVNLVLCKQGFNLNFNLHLLVFLKGAKLSNNSLILFKNLSVKQSIFCCLIFSVSFQLMEKSTRIKLIYKLNL